MLVRVLLAALFAGVLAGVFATAVQSYRVIPLILEAERYEGVEEGGGHSHSAETTSEETADGEEEAWGPADGGERLFYTGLANVVASECNIGYTEKHTQQCWFLDHRFSL